MSNLFNCLEETMSKPFASLEAQVISWTTRAVAEHIERIDYKPNVEQLHNSLLGSFYTAFDTEARPELIPIFVATLHAVGELLVVGLVCQVLHERTDFRRLVFRAERIDNCAERKLQSLLERALADSGNWRKATREALSLPTVDEREPTHDPLTPADFLVELQYVNCGGCVDGDCPHETGNDCATALIEELTRIATLARKLVPRTDELGKWERTKTEGETWQSAQYDGTYQHTVHKRAIRFAGEGNDCAHGASTEEGKHHNGSGPQAFGGAKEWPHVKLDVGLPVDRFDLRAELAAKLRDTVDAFITAHGLEP